VAATEGALVGAMEKLPEPAFCETVTVWPATVRVPLRELQVVLAVAAQETLALPLPLAGEQVRQVPALLLAFDAEPGSAVTVTLPLPPAAATEGALVGEIA